MGMRYRVFDINGYVGAYSNRQTFLENFKGGNPNYPIDGIIRVKDMDYRIFDFKESCSESSKENEFHEIENDWFTNLLVKPFSYKDIMSTQRDKIIRSYLNPIL